LPPKIAILSSFAQCRSRENVIGRMLLPRDRRIGADPDLTGADLRRQVAEALRREHQRVVAELAQLFGRLLLELDVGIAIGPPIFALPN
jgi:hypothetical protein